MVSKCSWCSLRGIFIYKRVTTLLLFANDVLEKSVEHQTRLAVEEMT